MLTTRLTGGDLYITGLSALCIPHPGRWSPLWYSLRSPDSRWNVGGKNWSDTSWFFGSTELVDVSEYLLLAEIETDLTLCASYERAVFDLLYRCIEKKGVPVPNVQPTDIDDVVSFNQVEQWVIDLERAGKLIHGRTMRAWLADDRRK